MKTGFLTYQLFAVSLGFCQYLITLPDCLGYVHCGELGLVGLVYAALHVQVSSGAEQVHQHALDYVGLLILHDTAQSLYAAGLAGLRQQYHIKAFALLRVILVSRGNAGRGAGACPTVNQKIGVSAYTS